MGLFWQAIGVLAALKVVDLADRLPYVFPDTTVLVVCVVWLAAAALLAARRVRAGCAVLVLGVAGVVAGGELVWNQHLWLFGWVGLGGLLFTERDVLAWYLTATASVVYGFAAVTKINPWFLAGDNLAFVPAPDALLPVLAVGAVGVELALAVNLWRRRGWWPTVAAGAILHLSIVAFVSVDVLHVARLVVFNGLAVALYLPAWERLGGVRAPTWLSGSPRDPTVPET